MEPVTLNLCLNEDHSVVSKCPTDQRCQKRFSFLLSAGPDPDKFLSQVPGHHLVTVNEDLHGLVETHSCQLTDLEKIRCVKNILKLAS